jgi:hypothetical protein
MSNKPSAAPMAHPQDFGQVLHHIQQTRQTVFAQANTALMALYWQVGGIISQKVAQAGWGKGVVTELAHYIAQTDPTIKGFSDKNLWRMKQFYETYGEDEKLATAWRVLPWSHNRLSALVAFELKVGQFKPEHMGQLNFYLEALDRDVKKPHENPSIGVLLCRDKDDEVVEYALSRNLSPALVAQYQLQLPDKKLIAAKLHAPPAPHEGTGAE